jgi:hypothetical protein
MSDMLESYFWKALVIIHSVMNGFVVFIVGYEKLPCPSHQEVVPHHQPGQPLEFSH